MSMCSNCMYYWKEDGEPFAQCRYCDERSPAPCEYEETEEYAKDFDEWTP
jgi:hypothetical protein